MRDKTHRVGTIIVLLLSFFIAILIYMAIQPLIFGDQSEEIAAIIAFSAGLFLNTSYLIFNFQHLKHDDTRINASTQIWFGILLIFASLITLILVGFLNVEFATSLIWMSGIVLISLYMSIDSFDEYLERTIVKEEVAEIEERKEKAVKKRKTKGKRKAKKA